MQAIGPLHLAVAKVEIGGVLTTIAVLNPMATVDPGGHETWKAQIEALKSFIPEVDGPLVIAGDLNTTRYRPEFQELLDAGLVDLIDSLGQAWKPSFSLKSVFPLGAARPHRPARSRPRQRRRPLAAGPQPEGPRQRSPAVRHLPGSA